jgi:CBS domain-containing protein
MTSTKKEASSNLHSSAFAEARELMRTYRIRRIPVVDSESKLAGLISFRHIIDEFFETIPRIR